MFYLIWINDTGEPGKLYGPDTFETCQKLLIQFVKDDEGLNLAPDTEVWRPDNESSAGWFIIQSEAF